ncbi:MAG: phosphate signaling complex protein PhoU [Planctomycetota bacterium]|nr:phosphate signaling complex protein PhoU [Planctomycetota bacterium]
MTKHLQIDLQNLERNLLALGARVEEAVRLSISALTSQRSDLAREVIAGDSEIDDAEVALEEECLKVLALHQPVAGDLRFVTACLKITNDLERIGDLAVSICKRSLAMESDQAGAAPNDLIPMTEATTDMLRATLEAFINEDGKAARQVILDDDHIDKLHKTNMRTLIARMEQEPTQINGAMLYISVSRHLERIADHATNIAEDVIYLTEGVIVRHQGMA